MTPAKIEWLLQRARIADDLGDETSMRLLAAFALRVGVQQEIIVALPNWHDVVSTAITTELLKGAKE